MPITTGKISWRANSANRTLGGLLNALRNFLVNSGNYTVIADQITSSNYFVVQSTRNTGFAGDRIIAQIVAYAGGTNGRWSHPFLGIFAFESWSGTTGTNTSAIPLMSPPFENWNSPRIEDYTLFSLSSDTDIWISCDNTFILTMSQIFNSALCSPVSGVACFERLPGDTDSGTFYGRVTRLLYHSAESPYNRIIYVPKRFDGGVGINGFYNVTTKLGSSTSAIALTMFGPDETDKHVVFDLGVNLASAAKFKGRIFGFNLTTYCNDFPQGCLLPSPSNAQYMVGRNSTLDLYYNTLMQVSPNIITITT